MELKEDSLTLTAAGDAMIIRKLRNFDNNRFHEIVTQIQDADASMVNLETLIHNYDGFPSEGATGTYMQSDPQVVDELSWMGFNLFSAATNHSFDYSHGGMEATMQNLEKRNITYAGLGRNLAAAVEPAYIDTPAGRIALVAACSTIPSHEAIAGKQRRDMIGRPGIAPLRYKTRYIVPEEQHEQIRQLSRSLGLEELKLKRTQSSYPSSFPKDGDDYFEFPNVDGSHLRFEVGDEFRIDRKANQADVSSLIDQIKRARRQADWVIASHHAHESANGRIGGQECASFVESYARSCIDAGADAYIGHGAHTLQGIEIYQEAPIFYDLGNFILQNQLVERLPTENYDSYDMNHDDYPVDLFDQRVYDRNSDPKGFLANQKNWESILPVCEYEENSLVGVTLYPLDLLQSVSRPGRGRPIVAKGEKADTILTRLSDLSSQYGTDIINSDGVGKVKI